MALLSCECVEGLIPFDKFTQIYAAAYALTGEDASLPTVECVAAMPPFDRLNAIYCALYLAAGGGCTTPTLLSATINGTTVTLHFNVAVTGGSGFTGSVVGTPAVYSYASGSGTTTIILTSDTSAESGDAVILNYAPGNVTNGACALAAISGFSVTNSTP